MRFLLDTHVWLWWTAGSSRIGGHTRQLFDDPSNELMLSAASAWEIAIKYRLGRLALPASPEIFIASQIARQSVCTVDVTIAHATATADLPLHHGDPFDRILVAQARCEALTLVTADKAMTPYAVAQLRI